MDKSTIKRKKHNALAVNFTAEKLGYSARYVRGCLNGEHHGIMPDEVKKTYKEPLVIIDQLDKLSDTSLDLLGYSVVHYKRKKDPQDGLTREEPRLLAEQEQRWGFRLVRHRLKNMDFMRDTLENGIKARSLNVMDDLNREVLQSSIDTGLPSAKVIARLGELIEWRGRPEKVRVDNGPEFIAEKLKGWCAFHGIELHFIQP